MIAKTLLGATIVALAFSTGGAFANPAGHDEHGQEMRGMRGGMHMLRGLDLTDEQKAQIRQIHERYHPQMQALHEQVRAEVQAVLTEEQRAELEAKRAERGDRMERMREHRRERGEHGEHGERRRPRGN